METVIVVIHLMVVISLVLVVLLQRSEGGALGIGGGGGGGLMSSRGTANVLTRATAILAVAFFATSITLTILARTADTPSSILDSVPSAAPATGGEAPATGNGIFDALQQQGGQAPSAPQAPSGPQVPTSQ